MFLVIFLQKKCIVYEYLEFYLYSLRERASL